MHTDQNFQVETDGPPPMGWDEYAHIVRREFRDLIDRPETTERHMQAFLEDHPCLVPGFDGFQGSDNEPGPIHSVLFSQPEIPSVPRRHRPDFMWLPTDSVRQWVVLVEIESPSKLWFTQGGDPQPRREFTQARGQIETWMTALDKSANAQQFCELYGLFGRPIEVRYCLIYGRRAEFVNDQDLSERRLAMAPANSHLMTYDRLTPKEAARNCICGRVRADGRIEAKTIPPTMQLSPNFIAHQGPVMGRPAATARSPHLSPPRGEFLQQRFQYWDGILRGGLTAGL